MLLLAEPSVYGFDEASRSSQGGDKRAIASLKREIAKQNERIDGLTSLIEGLNISLAQLRNSNNTPAISGSTQEIATQELIDIVNNINNTYVTKDELQRVINAKKVYIPEKKAEVVNKPTLDQTNTSKLYSEGVRLFVKQRYNEAEKRFIITDKKGYKPAASNYYLGEIAYYTKAYEDAIFYFKKSAGLYDQATYIDVLLLHAGISLAYTGDKEQAKMFYENIIENYQGRKSAKIAQQKLEKL